VVRVHAAWPHRVRAFTDAGYAHTAWDLVAVLTDHCPGGRLVDQIRSKGLTGRAAAHDGGRRQLLKWLAQAGGGLAHLHRRRLLHRNLNPGNFYLDRLGNVRVGGFAFLRSPREPNHFALPGIADLPFLRAPPPEMEEEEEHQVTTASDIWQMGCCIYYWLTGREVPVEGFWTIEKLIHQIPIDLKEALGDTLLLCLQRDPGVRATAQQLADRLNLASQM